MPPSRALTAVRSLRQTLHRLAQQRESLHAQFHHPLPPPRPVRPTPTVPVSSIASPVSCAVVPDALGLVRLHADSLLADSLARWRLLSHRAASMTTVGDTLLVFRSSLRHAYATRVARTLLRAPRRAAPRPIARFASPSAVCNAAAGMGLAAIVAQEQRDASGPASLLRLLSSTAGPQKVGIGWLPAPARLLLANLLACSLTGAAVYLVVFFPHAVPWLLVCAALCFAARPDLDSFRAWTRKCAPVVARNKTMLLDKLRAQVAPYVMGLRPPLLDDYGLFSIVTLMDHADYVYVYLGFLSRWCLLGWYNIADDYNFDRIRS